MNQNNQQDMENNNQNSAAFTQESYNLATSQGQDLASFSRDITQAVKAMQAQADFFAEMMQTDNKALEQSHQDTMNGMNGIVGVLYGVINNPNMSEAERIAAINAVGGMGDTYSDYGKAKAKYGTVSKIADGCLSALGSILKAGMHFHEKDF